MFFLSWLIRLLSSQDSDGEKSDDLVVDVSNEVSRAACNSKWHIDVHRDEAIAQTSKSNAVFLQDPATPRASPAHSPPENGIDKPRPPKKDTPNSPASVASSGSTPSSKAKELSHVRHQELRTN